MNQFSVPPVCKMSRAAEEAWWAKVAQSRGCVLSDWDNPRSKWRKTKAVKK